MKYTFLVYHKEYEDFLHAVRDLGVLHIIEKTQGIPEDDSALHKMLADESNLNRTIKWLEARAAGKGTLDKADINADYSALISQYESLAEQKTKEQHLQGTLQKEISRMEIWGNFNPADVERLHEAGYIMRFFSCPQRNFMPGWIDDYNAILIHEEGSMVYFITITPTGEPVDIDSADRIKPGKQSLHTLEQQWKASLEKETAIEKEINNFALKNLNTLKRAALRLREEFEYANVKLNTEQHADNKLMLVEGWVPVTKTTALNGYLNGQSIYYQAQKPNETENAPILLKNNAFTRLFEAVGELYDMPNYHELDLTPFFAPFFVMFFGLCLGDAGYGLLITIAALIARYKVKPSLKPVMTLAFWLGLGTVVFGAISGTLFGIPLLDVNWSWIQGMKKFMMNSDQLFNFALIVGAFQIIFGMVIKAIGSTRRFGFLRSLSHWGWLILIVGCGTAFGLEKLGQITSETSRIVYYIVIGIAAIGIFLFNDIKRNPLINVGAGLWDSYNMATGLMGDLLSYIRLFALGISGSVMGLVFNDLAMKLTESMPIVIAQIVMILILVFGHGMNIFMSGLGAFVHPMRLTFVEFYKNAGFEGGGKKYHPFAKQDKEENNK